MIADCCLQNFVHEIGHASNHGNDIRSLRVRDVNLYLQIDCEMKPFAALGLDLLQLCVEVVRLRHNISPVEGDDESGYDDGLIAPRIYRVFSRSKRFLPDAPVAGSNETAELELGA